MDELKPSFRHNSNYFLVEEWKTILIADICLVKMNKMNSKKNINFLPKHPAFRNSFFLDRIFIACKTKNTKRYKHCRESRIAQKLETFQTCVRVYGETSVTINHINFAAEYMKLSSSTIYYIKRHTRATRCNVYIVHVFYGSTIQQPPSCHILHRRNFCRRTHSPFGI